MTDGLVGRGRMTSRYRHLTGVDEVRLRRIVRAGNEDAVVELVRELVHNAWHNGKTAEMGAGAWPTR